MAWSRPPPRGSRRSWNSTWVPGVTAIGECTIAHNAFSSPGSKSTRSSAKCADQPSGRPSTKRWNREGRPRRFSTSKLNLTDWPGRMVRMRCLGTRATPRRTRRKANTVTALPNTSTAPTASGHGADSWAKRTCTMASAALVVRTSPRGHTKVTCKDTLPTPAPEPRSGEVISKAENVTLPGPSENSRAAALAVQPDGEVVVTVTNTASTGGWLRFSTAKATLVVLPGAKMAGGLATDKIGARHASACGAGATCAAAVAVSKHSHVAKQMRTHGPPRTRPPHRRARLSLAVRDGCPLGHGRAATRARKMLRRPATGDRRLSAHPPQGANGPPALTDL